MYYTALSKLFIRWYIQRNVLHNILVNNNNVIAPLGCEMTCVEAPLFPVYGELLVT